MKKLVTHNGRFHQDEVTAAAMLTLIFPDSELIRTRDPKTINLGDIVFDVGGIFDPKSNKFDHHQFDFTETFSGKYTQKLSSAGLIYKYFHVQLFEYFGLQKTHAKFDFAVDKIYENFFLGIDNIDNGVEFESNYKVRSLANFIGSFNDHFNTNNHSVQYNRFISAMEVVKTDLINYFKYFIEGILPQYEILERLILESEEIIVTSENICVDLICELEKDLHKNIKYVVFSTGPAYRIYAINEKQGSFKPKVPLKKEWCGLRDEVLQEVSGIKSAVFVHMSGFTGGALVLEDAILMCKMSL